MSKFTRYLILFISVACIGALVFYNRMPLNQASASIEATNEQSKVVGTGCLFNSERLKKESIFNFRLDADLNSSMLSSYSLEDYLPPIGDQGDVGSCVGWSTTYYGFTIVKRIEHGKDYPAFSPLSVFNRFAYLKGVDPCRNGAYIDECLSLLTAKGCPFEKEYDKPNCSVDGTKKHYSNCLFNYERLQHNNVKQLKMALLKNCPVIIGMNVFAGGRGNALNSRFLDSAGVLKMENFYNNKNTVGGHALCVVGYDDEVGGGAFKIVNSWGKDWGKDGFFWLRYNDLEVLRCAYAMFPDEETTKSKSAFKTTTLEVYNNSTKGVYIALAYETEKGKKSRGWYFIDADQVRNINIAERSTNGVSYMLMNEQGKIFASKSTKNQYPLKLNGSFEVLNSKGSDLNSYNLNSITPSNKRKIQTVNIVGTTAPKLVN